MIHVVAQNNIKGDKIEAFIAIASKLVEDTNTLDKGCIRYELVQDIKNPSILTFIETWEDMPSLKSHMAASHHTEALEAIKDFYQSPTTVNIYKDIV